MVANYPNMIFSISVTSYDFSFFNTAITKAYESYRVGDKGMTILNLSRNI